MSHEYSRASFEHLRSRQEFLESGCLSQKFASYGNLCCSTFVYKNGVSYIWSVKNFGVSRRAHLGLFGVLLLNGRTFLAIYVLFNTTYLSVGWLIK